MCPVRSVTYVASRSSPVNTRAFSLLLFWGSHSKKQFANYLPTFGTAKYLDRELPATVTGSGCTSLKPEWGEDYLEPGCVEGLLQMPAPQMDQFGINRRSILAQPIDSRPTS